jgi:hypothetical protein
MKTGLIPNMTGFLASDFVFFFNKKEERKSGFVATVTNEEWFFAKPETSYEFFAEMAAYAKSYEVIKREYPWTKFYKEYHKGYLHKMEECFEAFQRAGIDFNEYLPEGFSEEAILSQYYSKKPETPKKREMSELTDRELGENCFACTLWLGDSSPDCTDCPTAIERAKR